jgi:transposase
MMGIQEQSQGKLFYTNINLEKRVRANHPLRRIDQLIDFDFTYNDVDDKYGNNGQVSVPPPVILKLMLLLLIYNVRSERELMTTLPERLDWLWFLGYDFDSNIPDHSVLSKARARWGVEVFKSFFERIVFQCVQAGLVDGRKIFMDSSLIDADASNNSVIDIKALKNQVQKNYKELEARLEERNADSAQTVNKRYISTTDPDASIVRRGNPKLRYQVHRAVDEAHEVITATEATPGDVNEAHRLEALIDQHNAVTEKTADTIVADSKYGTIDNFLACHDRGVQAHMPDLGKAAKTRNRKTNIFTEDHFRYDPDQDVYICPQGQQLKRKTLHPKRSSIDYGAPKKACSVCDIRDQCTKNKTGRTVKRHLRHEELDQMRSAAKGAKSKRDIKTRQHLMERSFAQAKRYGFDRARWRGLWRMHIQEYLICAIQNIQILANHGAIPKCSPALAIRQVKATISTNDGRIKAISASISAKIYGYTISQLTPC